MTREERIKTLSNLIDTLENFSKNYEEYSPGKHLAVTAKQFLSSLKILEEDIWTELGNS